MSASRIIYLVLRRMRPPLLVLLASYAISLLGMTLIPGLDENGEPWRMDFFHALYFLSYTATTIGFGEIPYPFTNPQRAWVLVSIYLTVIAWFYAIGTILALVQDPALRRVVVRTHFARQVQRIREPYYIICGFGDTGCSLVRAMVERFRRVVVVDIDPDAISELTIKNYPVYVPSMVADASVPETLEQAGLGRFYCSGVVAVTPSDDINLKIAISSKLLSTRVPVYCQGEHADIEANMASFGTDFIIDPYVRFSQQLGLAIRSPGIYLLHHWLNAVPHSQAEEPVYPPHGTWVLCGYGRFGKAIHNVLRELGIPVVVIEANPAITHSPPGGILGRGTEAKTLSAAGIESAVAIVAGTDNDTNNLSIAMTAKMIKPDLFLVIRQDNAENWKLFERIGADLLMNPSDMVSREIRVLLTEPLLAEFLSLSKDHDNNWGTELVSRLAAITDSEVPAVWSVTVSERDAAGVMACLREGLAVGIRHLSMDPKSREGCLRCFPLMLRRVDHTVLLPEANSPLAVGDRVLFCGTYGMNRRMAWLIKDPHGFRYLVTGTTEPVSSLGRWWAKRELDKREEEADAASDS